MAHHARNCKARRGKIRPNANLIVNNVKKVLLRLASKNLRIPIEQLQISLIFTPWKPQALQLTNNLQPSQFLFQVIKSLRIAVHIHPGSQDAATGMVATIKKAKERKLCGHSVDDLKEANFNPDVRSARAGRARPIICNRLILTDTNTDTDCQNIKPIPIPIIFSALISNRYRYWLCKKYRLIGKIPIMDTDYSLYQLNSDFNRYRYQYRLIEF